MYTETFFRQLERQMMSKQCFGANQVLLAQDVDLAKVLANYSSLVMWIVPLLTRVKEECWLERCSTVARELERNIAEEEGSDSGGVSHRELFAEHMRCIGITLPALNKGADPELYDPATCRFITWLWQMVDESDLAAALGVAYALECTATPELRVVGHLLNRYCTEVRGRVEVLTEDLLAGELGEDEYFIVTEIEEDGDTLASFFARHLQVWEKGHRDLLEVAVRNAPQMQDEKAQGEFEGAFLQVIGQMNLWWSELAKLA